MQRKLICEQLQKREMMAGDVDVWVDNGDLKVVGDGQDNGVMISQVNHGVYRVQGLDQNGMTSINGYKWLEFGGVTEDIEVDLAGGNDYLNVSNAYNQLRGRTFVPDDLNIDMGTGSDRVFINETRVNDSVFAELGSHADRFYMSYSSVNGTGWGDGLRVVGDDGFSRYAPPGYDVIDVHDVAIARDLDIDAGSGWSGDRIDLSRLNVGGDLEIDTAEGRDHIDLWFSTIGDDVDIETRGGDDYVLLWNVQMDELDADLGAGNDDALTLYSVSGRRANLDGGSGYSDYLRLVDATFSEDLDYEDFEQWG
jgi:hypothetical protein